MENFEQLKRQQATLNSLGSIVKTMKNLAAINAIPYEQAAKAIQAYQATVKQGFTILAYLQQYRFQQPSLAQSELIIAFGSDHGLCGNYNQLVAEHVAHYQAQSTNAVSLVCLGVQLAKALDEFNIQPLKTLMPAASAEGLSRLAGALAQEIETLSLPKVTLIYTKTNNKHKELAQEQLLPLNPKLLHPPKRWHNTVLPVQTQPTEQLFSALVRNYLFSQLYLAAAEAMVTENQARLERMQQAEETIQDRLANLTLEMNQIRQDEITSELLDIIAATLVDDT